MLTTGPRLPPFMCNLYDGLRKYVNYLLTMLFIIVLVDLELSCLHMLALELP